MAAMGHRIFLHFALLLAAAPPVAPAPALTLAPARSLPPIDSDGGMRLPPPAGAHTNDELQPIAAGPLIGKSYPGAGLPAEIQFINVRRRSVRLNWIDFDGRLRLYAVVPSGGEVLQHTFVSHRWVITSNQAGISNHRATGRHRSRAAHAGVPIEAFIATRSNAHGDGQPQIAIIR
jgi:hypothetical protein